MFPVMTMGPDRQVYCRKVGLCTGGLGTACQPHPAEERKLVGLVIGMGQGLLVLVRGAQ